MKSLLIVFSMIGFALVASVPVSAETNTLTDNSGWHFSAQIYAWAFGDSGDLTIGGHSAHLDDSFLDTLRQSDSLLAFMGPARADHRIHGALVRM